MIVADTSVVVAALASWHERHRDADAALPRTAVAHCLAEAYSVFTRMPEPRRVPPDQASAVLRARFDRALTLPAREALALPVTLSRLGISGGATYDALIALTAASHGAELVPLDERALGTYRRCGVPASLI